MIDVSKFHRGARCPRCLERRVVGVREEWNEWCCAPNAMPFPSTRDIKVHDATASADDVRSVIELQQAAQARLIENAKSRR